MSDVVSDNLDASDASDLAAACAGDHAAFARLYDRHAAVVLSLCRRRAGFSDPSGGEDALQETFIRAFRMLEKIHDPLQFRHFRGWLYAIARRVCAERRRTRQRRIRHETAAMNPPALTLNSHALPLAIAAADEALDLLSHALDQLDDRQRLAIHLYYLDSDPVAAAATALHCSRSAYYKLLAQAQARLATLMREVHTS